MEADWKKVGAILRANCLRKNRFAQSLLQSFEQYGRLTKGQLDYVLGRENPKGFSTFEQEVFLNGEVLNYEGDEDENQRESKKNFQAREVSKIVSNDRADQTGSMENSTPQSLSTSSCSDCQYASVLHISPIK